MFGVSGGREFVLDGDTGWGDADAVWEESVVRVGVVDDLIEKSQITNRQI